MTTTVVARGFHLKQKLSEAELAEVEIFGDEGPMRAGRITEVAGAKHGWGRNTGYTLINRLIKKVAVKRDDPNFLCMPIVRREEIRKLETKKLLEKMYGGSINLL